MAHNLPTLWAGFEYHHHQVEGVKWMCNQEDNSPCMGTRGGLLCDEMGLGKTIQAIALLRCRPVKYTLLVAPLAVLEQWAETAHKARVNVWRPHKTLPKWQAPERIFSRQPSIYICNYERLVARPALGDCYAWDRLICDEAHRVVSRGSKIIDKGSKTFQRIATLQVERKWFLTGTPIVNSRKEAETFLFLLGHPAPPTTWEALKPLIPTFCLHRSMEMLRNKLSYLPFAAVEHHHTLDFDSKEEASFYKGIQGAIVRQWEALDGENDGLMKLVLLNRLRQISIHPQVYISNRKKAMPSYSRPDFTESSTKFTALKALIEKENDKPHKWLVFCHFQTEMELLKKELDTDSRIRRCSIYNGTLTAAEKEQVIQKTKESLPSSPIQHEVLLAQLRSGGVGLNLQHFDRIAFMGPWWTAALMDQAIGRAVRIGQKEHVHVHYLRLKEEETLNIDMQMFETAEEKRQECQRFLDSALHLL